MIVKMGTRELELGGKYLGLLREANDLVDDPAALHARMEEDGCLLLRGLHDPERVKVARRIILDGLNENEQLDRAHPIADGIAAEGKRGHFLGGIKKLTRVPGFLALVEAPQIMGFFEHFLGGPVLTYDYKWLRAIGPGDGSGAHYDIPYMGRGTLNVYTTWTPLGDVPYEMGPLAVWVGSHRLERIKETYGQIDVDRDHITGNFSDDPIELVDRYGGQWKTSEFTIGDVMIFGMFTMHASLRNVTNRYRLSTDTRYQLASEPVDERWMGEDPIAHYAWTKGTTVPMEEMRKQWGV